MAAPLPGLLYVPLQQKSLTDAELNNWYNNQHAPARMCYPFFSNGCRYSRITESTTIPAQTELSNGEPDTIALYEISDMHQLVQAPYITLLDPRVQGQRDRDTISKIAASRRYFDHVVTYRTPRHQNELLLREDEKTLTNGILVVVHVRLKSCSKDAEAEFLRWYEEDHLPPLRKVPGWSRSRIYRTSVVESFLEGNMEFMTLNEFADPKQVGGPEHQIAIQTESNTTVVASKKRDCWTLEFMLGRGPKDLQSLRDLTSDQADYVSPDGLIRTTNEDWPKIISCAPVGNGSVVEYCLEGRGDPDSQIIVLGTVSMLHWDVWDQFTSSIMKKSDDVRVLRVRSNAAFELKNEPMASGPSFLELGKCIDAVKEALLLPAPALILHLGIAGETVDRRFDNYIFEDLASTTRSETLRAAESTDSTPKLVIIARNNMAIMLAMSRLISSLEEAETMLQWSRKDLQVLVEGVEDA